MTFFEKIYLGGQEFYFGVGGAASKIGALTIDAASIGAHDHLVLNRSTYNYIRCSAEGSSLNIVTGGKTVTTANSDVIINQYGMTVKTGSVPTSESEFALCVGGNIVPSATGSYTLGSASKRFERGYIRYLDTPSGYNLRLCTAGTEAMNISTSGNVFIGGSTSAASYKLQVDGSFNASSADISGALSVTGATE